MSKKSRKIFKKVAVLVAIAIGLLFINFVYKITTGTSFFERHINYNGVSYHQFATIPIKFKNGNPKIEIWGHNLNVDGDYMRIIVFQGKNQTQIFELNNAVNNYTEIKCYSIISSKIQYFWMDDNFGTKGYAIDSTITEIFNKNKQLTELTPSGSPIGSLQNISIPQIRKKLKINSKEEMQILDSLTSTM